MNIIASCQMGPGTFEAKFIPLSRINRIKNIYVLRKEAGVNIDKVKYIVLPRICRIKLIYILIAPLYLLYYSKKHKARLILSYHVIPHAFFAYVASIVTGIPYSISQTGLMVQKLSERGIIGRLIMHIIYKASYINVPGKSSLDHWIKKGIDPRKIKILHSTISTDQYRNLDVEKKFDFIFVGRLAPEKNLELIFKALLILKEKGLNFRIAIVGDGPERGRLEQFVDKNKLDSQISFLGFQINVVEWLNKSDIFLLTSSSDALPTALMQAMACELICICSNVGNISDMIINGKTGFLFGSGNTQGLAEIMNMAFQAKGDLLQLRKNAREIVINNHSHTSVLEKWESHLDQLEYSND